MEIRILGERYIGGNGEETQEDQARDDCPFSRLSFLAMRSPIPSISFGSTIAGPGTEKSWQDSTGTSKSFVRLLFTIIHSDEDAVCEEDYC